METASLLHLGPGTLLDGRYRIQNLLGEGGMGAVYLARQLTVDRDVAIKILKADAAQLPVAAARFREEMQVTSRLEHPNTIRLYDFGEVEGGLYLVMECLHGKTLRQVIDHEGHLAPRRALHVLRQIALGLGAAHALGVVHRDLKPDNVMLVNVYGDDDFVKVMDFGISRSMDELRPQLTLTGQVIGTPAYMAPEQASAEPLDHRTDLYALGIIAYELLSGVVPFQRPTAMSLLMAHVRETPPALAPRVPGLSASLEALVMRLLEKAPAARPQSAAEVVALTELCSSEIGQTSSAVPPQSGGTAVLPASTPSSKVISRPQATSPSEVRALGTWRWVKPLLLLALAATGILVGIGAVLFKLLAGRG